MTWRGPYADDYHSRDTALALIEAMKTAKDWREVTAMTGIERPQIVADQCFMVYGYPELDPVEVARWSAQTTMRGGMSKIAQASSAETPARDTYGFTPRG
ncbi:hypothetical protein NKY40_27685 [Sinorhizobium meliloti]|uniref:hypothetical protein n=1 Tax=Rhizobium meliloti TaxID=382 RepID=UPI003D64CE27